MRWEFESNVLDRGTFMRIILYTGKGGVGKTSIAASTAVRAAQLGHRTIVLSTDPAHSLADSLDMKVGYAPVQVAQNLYAQEIDVNTELRSHYQTIQRFLTSYLRRQGFDQVVAEEFAVFPGMEELFSLLRVKEYFARKAYDVIIIDCAPTGSTVRMLSFPEAIRWYMTRFFHVERRIVKAIRPLAERITNMPLPTDEVYFSVEDLYQKIQGMNDLLTDPAITSIRLVLNPEKMVIKESQRAYTYLNLFGFNVDSVIANRILPADLAHTYLEKWLAIQEKHMKVAEESFSPLPIYQARLFDQEMVGLEMLGRMAADIFQGEDPTRIFHQEKSIEILPRGGKQIMRIRFPSMKKEELDLWVKGDELIVQAGWYRRSIFLPRALALLSIQSANYVDGKLEITFGG
ncbi:MAG: ArsA family ATPase [Candidatus Tectomicrobia bacterium]|uniref:arsenite-transporting ATPase n=1 Tax=Tectimicrobiota bacterium TaxID=2528274 RepID=A0A932CMZ8_UNCTE|nr:ArsA family ATPase [Candidatus Tectomicrobia bacterium]